MRSDNLKTIALLSACLFIMPIIGWYVGNLSERTYEEQFFDAVVNQNKELTEEEYRSENISYMSFCKNSLADSSDPDINEICTYYKEVKYVKIGSLVTFAVGLLLILVIIIGSKYAGLNRKRLSTIFGPLVRIVMGLLAISILVQGALFIYSIYTLEAIFIQRVHFGILIGIGLGTLIACWTLLKYALVLIKNNPMHIRGYVLDRKIHTKIFELVDKIALNLGANSPSNIVVGLEPNFYVTTSEIVIIGNGQSLSGRTLFLSLSLLRLFNEDELVAVIGHELGHFKGDDVLYSMKFAPTYTRLGSALNELSINSESSSDIAKLPALFALGYCLNEFAKAERTIGRDRELLADKAGVDASNPDSLAIALIKVSLFANFWDSLTTSHIDNLANGKTYTNLAHTYSDYCLNVLNEIRWEEAIENIAEVRQAHPVDTHPTLTTRLDNIGANINSYKKEQIETIHTPAINLIVDGPEIEEHLSNIEAQWLEAIGAVILPRN